MSRTDPTRISDAERARRVIAAVDEAVIIGARLAKLSDELASTVAEQKRREALANGTEMSKTSTSNKAKSKASPKNRKRTK